MLDPLSPESWYLTPDGRNTTLYPGFNWEYRLRTTWFNPFEYELVAEDGGAVPSRWTDLLPLPTPQTDG